MEQIAFDKLFDSLEVVQGRYELFWLVNKVEELKPQAIMEIGVEFGGSMKFWEYILPPEGFLIGIDAHPNLFERFAWDYLKSTRRVSLVKGDSTNVMTMETVNRSLEHHGIHEVDFLYIDGDHALKTVQSDFAYYSRFVRSGGIVGFHDLFTDTHNPFKVFNELEGEKEQMHNVGQGTGIWWKP